MENNFIRFTTSFILACLFHFFIIRFLLAYISDYNILLEIISFLFVFFTFFILLKGFYRLSRFDWIVLTFIYFISISFMLLGREDMGIAITELDPIEWIRQLYYGSTNEWVFAFFNIIGLIPLPIIFGYWFHNNFFAFLLSLFTSSFFEFLQVILHRGVFDVGDILLYWIGITFCFLTFYHVHWIYNHRS